MDRSSLMLPEDRDRAYLSDGYRPALMRDPAMEQRAPAADGGAESYLDLLKRTLPDPGILDEHGAYLWRSTMSTAHLDTYGTIMGKSSLRNYAADAAEGRAFLVGHNRQMTPVGYSLDGTYHDGRGSGVARADQVAYSIRIPSTADFIDSMRAGHIRDTSISFGSRDMRWICSIDGADMLRATWEECPHFPNQYYKKDGTSRRKAAPDEELILCTATVEDAHMSETSAVYDGATPGASILKAVRAAEAGLITPEQRIHLEQHLRIRLPGAPPSYAPWGLRTEEEESVPPDGTIRGAGDPPADAGVVTPPAAVAQAIDLRLQVHRETWSRELGLTLSDDPLADIRQEFARLRPLADAGATYRADLIGRVLDDGTRALGADFQREEFKADLERMDIDAIRRQATVYQRMAEAAIPTGRRTSDAADLQVSTSPNGFSTRGSRS